MRGWAIVGVLLFSSPAVLAQEATPQATPQAIPQAALPAAQSALLPRGTVLELMVLNEVSSRDAQPGTRIVLRLNKPLLIDGRLVLPEGTPVFGEVLETKGSQAAGGRGKLTARLNHIQNGAQRIGVTGDMDALGKGGKSDDALKWMLAPFYAPFAPGNNAKLKAGALVNGAIEADHDVIWEADGKAQINPRAATGPVS